MSRPIDADKLKANCDIMVGNTTIGRRDYVMLHEIDSAPTIDAVSEWIPCSERLPTEEEQDDELGVLVTLGNGYSGLQYDWYSGDHWYDWDGFIIAWMPLPEPWEGADDE